MRAAKILTLLLPFFLLSETGVSQQVHTYVDVDSLRVGDLFTFTIVLNGSYREAEFPDEEDFNEELTVRSIQRFQTVNGTDSLVYRLQFFAVDNYTIPAKEIYLEQAEADTVVTTTPVPLAFKTVLAEDEQNFRPLKPIFEFARNWWPYIIGLLIVFLAGYLVYRYYFLTSKEEAEPVRQPESPPPFVSPLDNLKRQIQSLPAIESLENHERYEDYYIRLGDSIREYIKKVYRFPALEMTTSEISLKLQREHASPKLVSITRKVLMEADVVKFANFTPEQSEAESAFQKAEQFIQTAEVVNHEQIQYLKYQYESEHGIIKGSSIKTNKET